MGDSPKSTSTPPAGPSPSQLDNQAWLSQLRCINCYKPAHYYVALINPGQCDTCAGHMDAVQSYLLCALECFALTERHPPTTGPSSDRVDYVQVEYKRQGQCCYSRVVHYTLYEGGRLGENSKATMDTINEWADRKFDKLMEVNDELMRLEINRSSIFRGYKDLGVQGEQLVRDLISHHVAGRTNPRYPTAASVARRVAELEFLYDETEGRIRRELDILRQGHTLPSSEDDLVMQAQQELGIEYPVEWPWITVRKESEKYAAAEQAKEYDESDSDRPAKRRRKNKRKKQVPASRNEQTGDCHGISVA